MRKVLTGQKDLGQSDVRLPEIDANEAGPALFTGAGSSSSPSGKFTFSKWRQVGDHAASVHCRSTCQCLGCVQQQTVQIRKGLK